ncbi:MAG: tyrosine-type recombinase/integrase, partial [Planctomycetota bacterium]
ALDVEDVDLEAGELWLRTTKNDRPDRVFLAPATVELLRPFIEGRSGPLFTGRNGHRLSSRHVQRRLAMWLGRVGVTRHASPHSLRHSFATRLYEKTGDMLLVKSALGHRSILSTAIYAHAGGDRLRNALSG